MIRFLLNLLSSRLKKFSSINSSYVRLSNSVTILVALNWTFSISSMSLLNFRMISGHFSSCGLTSAEWNNPVPWPGDSLVTTPQDAAGLHCHQGQSGSKPSYYLLGIRCTKYLILISMFLQKYASYNLFAIPTMTSDFNSAEICTYLSVWIWWRKRIPFVQPCLNIIEKEKLKKSLNNF